MKDEVLQRLDALAAKLGVASEHIWAVLTRQGVVYGAAGVAGFAFGLGLMAIVLRRDMDWTDFDQSFPSYVVVIFAIVFMAFSLDHALYLFNPEYFALSEIGRLLTSGR